MLDEFLELINPFNSGNQKGHEIDSDVDEMTIGRSNELTDAALEVVNVYKAHHTGASALRLPQIDFGRPYFSAAQDAIARETLTIDNPTGTEAAVPAKLKQESHPITPQPAEQTTDVTSSTQEQDMAAQSRVALDSIYAEMPTTKPNLDGDELTLAY